MSDLRVPLSHARHSARGLPWTETPTHRQKEELVASSSSLHEPVPLSTTESARSVS